jgi:hypothetical protein
MPDVREKQREARRKIIRQWAKLPKDINGSSMEGISEFARTAAQQNENVRIPTKSPRRTDMKSPVDSETMSPTFPI